MPSERSPLGRWGPIEDEALLGWIDRASNAGLTCTVVGTELSIGGRTFPLARCVQAPDSITRGVRSLVRRWLSVRDASAPSPSVPPGRQLTWSPHQSLFDDRYVWERSG